MSLRILVRGGGDLGSGVILRAARAGWQVAVAELPHPVTVRRTVSFSEAVYENQITIENIHAEKTTPEDVPLKAKGGQVCVVVDAEADLITLWKPHVLVDARMMKAHVRQDLSVVPLVIGLGPGFTAGENCHAVIETQRGPYLGRVFWQGSASADTGIPENVAGYGCERVLRAPRNGEIQVRIPIGERVSAGQILAEVEGVPVLAPFDGVVRGMVRDGLTVTSGMKIGDVDPRGDPAVCYLVSDKSLAIGGGVLEAVLTCDHLRVLIGEGEG